MHAVPVVHPQRAGTFELHLKLSCLNYWLHRRLQTGCVQPPDMLLFSVPCAAAGGFSVDVVRHVQGSCATGGARSCLHCAAVCASSLVGRLQQLRACCSLICLKKSRRRQQLTEGPSYPDACKPVQQSEAHMPHAACHMPHATCKRSVMPVMLRPQQQQRPEAAAFL